MCLSEITKKYSENNKLSKTAYKVMLKTKDGQYHSPFFRYSYRYNTQTKQKQPCNLIGMKIGQVYKDLNELKQENYRIGFHAYKHKKEAAEILNREKRMFSTKNFVACGQPAHIVICKVILEDLCVEGKEEVLLPGRNIAKFNCVVGKKIKIIEEIG